MALATYGIKKFEWGAAGANGAMGATLADITKIVQDSVQVTFPEPTQTDITAEEDDNPFVVLTTAGKKVITLKSHNVAAADLPGFFGGASATVSGVTTFTPGVQYALGEKSVQFTTRPLQGKTQTWKFPRTQVFISVDSNPSKTNTMQITFTINVLQPYDGTGAAIADFLVVEQAA